MWNKIRKHGEGIINNLSEFFNKTESTKDGCWAGATQLWDTGGGMKSGRCEWC